MLTPIGMRALGQRGEGPSVHGLRVLPAEAALQVETFLQVCLDRRARHGVATEPTLFEPSSGAALSRGPSEGPLLESMEEREPDEEHSDHADRPDRPGHGVRGRHVRRQKDRRDDGPDPHGEPPRVTTGRCVDERPRRRGCRRDFSGGDGVLPGPALGRRFFARGLRDDPGPASVAISGLPIDRVAAPGTIHRFTRARRCPSSRRGSRRTASARRQTRTRKAHTGGWMRGRNTSTRRIEWIPS